MAQRFHPNSFRAAIGLLAVSACGCRTIENRFEVLSLKNPADPVAYAERFERGAFAVDARANHKIVFLKEPWLVSQESPDQGGVLEEVWMSQLMLIEVFWRPIPGKTYVESSQTNASIVYCLVRGNTAVSYEGAGFVYFTLSRDGQSLEGRIESATLRPRRTKGDATDLFGPCHLSGRFTAKLDRPPVAETRQRLRRLFGPPKAPAPGVPGLKGSALD